MIQLKEILPSPLLAFIISFEDGAARLEKVPEIFVAGESRKRGAGLL